MKSAYLFYLDGIERALSQSKFIVGNKLTIADISFVCELAQFLRERDRRNVINEQGYELISQKFEKEFPNSFAHLKGLSQKMEFRNVMLDYVEKALATK